MILSSIIEIFLSFSGFLYSCMGELLEATLQQCLLSARKHADSTYVGSLLKDTSCSISLEEKISLYRDILNLHHDIKYRIIDAKNVGWYYFHQSPSTEVLIMVKDIVDREIYCLQLMLICFIQYCKFLPEFSSVLN